MDPFSPQTLVMCFAGGIVGGALGGLFSFIICGLMVMAGCLVIMASGSDFVLLQIGLGPIFGPHVGGFAAGVAASTYAAGIKKNHPGGAAKDILSALMGTSWDVLLVGGLAALAGHLLLQLFALIPIVNKTDMIALSVVATAFLARFLFQKEMPWGNKKSISDIGYLKTDGHKISWVPWMLPLPKMVLYGFAAGVLSAAMAAQAKIAMDPLAASGAISAAGAFVVPLILGWAAAAISLIALQLGTGAIQQVPVWHCQAILAALAYLYFGNIMIAGLVGASAALLQELMARMFWNHGSNHVDPPAAAIAVGTLMLNIIK
ncbi:hypothetical protein [Maridesulfovibrio hydrothermalis]|uniref:DUF7973 domain-containing protein n=1 Tax=Maridesulfovibrio hydrothermalis AM13 = DSM 14728 TaxID=1121451 RepID=L0RCX2_9BACT|nr:hypothetical protein [Maridesulfovibrio hydrothermalis]CCO23396.1 conserved membrane protein of unknown function [Maridesulfovibrio hydrothermalis AM13 = DSM 14728]